MIFKHGAQRTPGGRACAEGRGGNATYNKDPPRDTSQGGRGGAGTAAWALLGQARKGGFCALC
jgi:hypothetical protein